MSQNNGRLQLGRVRIEGFKCIDVVEITPEGGITRIQGDTGQGKTSILDAIEVAFRGSKDATFVRRGDDGSRIYVECGNLDILRSLNADGSQKVAVSEGGLPLTAKLGQERLSEIAGPHVFRPMKWVQLAAGDAAGRTVRLRQQRDELLRAIPMRLDQAELVSSVEELGVEQLTILSEISLDTDPTQQHGLLACEIMHDACYQARTAANKDVEAAEIALRALPVPGRNVPKEDLKTLVAQEKKAEQAWHQAIGAKQNQAATLNRAENLRESIARQVEALAGAKIEDEQALIEKGLAVSARIEALRVEISQLETQKNEIGDQYRALRGRNQDLARQQAQLQRDQEELAGVEASFGQAVADPDTALKTLEVVRNQKSAREIADKHAEGVAKLQKATGRAAALTSLVTLFREVLPHRLLERAQFPVKGLGIEGDQLTVDGIAIQRLGTSEQIRLGVEVAIALNPKAGFICVDGAESLGVEGRIALAEAAEKHGVQIIMTQVQPDPEPGAIVMEGGVARQVA